MPSKAPVTPLDERTLDAETRASQWFVDGNAAQEAGCTVKAERCFQKEQFWLDRANLLRPASAGFFSFVVASISRVSQ